MWLTLFGNLEGFISPNDLVKSAAHFYEHTHRDSWVRDEPEHDKHLLFSSGDWLQSEPTVRINLQV